MAHNIQSMFYTGAKPWHGLGSKHDKHLTASEAITAAGLDWEVGKFEVQNPVNPMLPTGFFGTYRKDNGHVFKVGFKAGYTVIQNKDVFSFADQLVQDSGAKYETAGSLGNGEKIWALAKLPKQVRIQGTDDVSNLYLLLANSHNGSMTMKCALTSVRVVCQNTLVGGLAAATKKTSIFHKANAIQQVTFAQQNLGLIFDQIETDNMLANKLAGELISKAQISAMLNALIPLKKDDDNSLQENWRGQILSTFEDNDGNMIPKIAGTKWAFLNGITRWVDHIKAPHANPELVNIDKKHESLLFGADADFKAQATELILGL